MVKRIAACYLIIAGVLGGSSGEVQQRLFMGGKELFHPPKELADLIEEEYISTPRIGDSDNLLRQLTLSVTNEAYRTEYATRIDDWLRRETTWPNALILNTYLKGELDWVEPYLYHSDQDVLKAAQLIALVNKIPSESISGSGATQSSDAVLYASVEAVRTVLVDDNSFLDVTYRLENRNNRGSISLFHPYKDWKLFQINRADGVSTVPVSTPIHAKQMDFIELHARETIVRTARFRLNRMKPEFANDQDVLSMRYRCEHEICFIGDIMIGTRNESKVALELIFSFGDRDMYIFKPESKIIDYLPPKVISEPISFCIDLEALSLVDDKY